MTSTDILRAFTKNNKTFFYYSELIAAYPGKSMANYDRILDYLQKKGLLLRINRGLYNIIPMDRRNYIPDWRLVAKYYMQDRDYYLGFHSAMKIHELSSIESPVKYIVTNTQIKPNSLELAGSKFKFVTQTKEDFSGFREKWINEHEKIMVSELEKTIADALRNPQYCGGIKEVARAIYISYDRFEHNNLFFYLADNRIHAAKKRFLFLCDLLELEWTRDHDILLGQCGRSFSPLDPAGNLKGRRDNKFGLILNTDTKQLKEDILKEFSFTNRIV